MEKSKASVWPSVQSEACSFSLSQHPQDDPGEVSPFHCTFFCFFPGIPVFSLIGVKWPKEKLTDVCFSSETLVSLNFFFSLLTSRLCAKPPSSLEGTNFYPKLCRMHPDYLSVGIILMPLNYFFFYLIG